MMMLFRKSAAVFVTIIVALAVAMQFHHHDCIYAKSHASMGQPVLSTIFCVDHNESAQCDDGCHGDGHGCEDGCGLQLAPATLTADNSLLHSCLQHFGTSFPGFLTVAHAINEPTMPWLNVKPKERRDERFGVKPDILSSAPTRGKPHECGIRC